MHLTVTSRDAPGSLRLQSIIKTAGQRSAASQAGRAACRRMTTIWPLRPAPVSRVVRDEAVPDLVDDGRVQVDEQRAQSPNAAAHDDHYWQLPQAHVQQAQHIRCAGVEHYEEPASIQALRHRSHVQSVDEVYEMHACAACLNVALIMICPDQDVGHKPRCVIAGC